MPFWSAVDGTRHDPKRQSRFKLFIGALNESKTVWYAKSFTKPTAEVNSTTHRYLNHTFNYPGSVKWNDIDIELIDPTDPIDTAASMAQLLTYMGYQIPSGGGDLVNISKRKSVDALGDIYVEQIDDQGQTIEKWTLRQAFVKKFDWGSYKYDSDDLNTLKLMITYDWATCEKFSPDVDPAETPSAVKVEEEKSYWKDITNDNLP
jgi:hypothetical protein